MSEPRYALFPARVTLPDGTVHDPARVATDTAGITHAWTWTDGGPREIGRWAATDLTRSDGATRGHPTQLAATDGARIDTAKGCGCGHPLKTWRPALVAPGA